MKLVALPAKRPPLLLDVPTLPESHTAAALAEAADLWHGSTRHFNRETAQLHEGLAAFFARAAALDQWLARRLDAALN